VGTLPPTAGDRVLTPDLRLGTVVSLHRTLDKLRGGKPLRGEWYAIVKLDGGGSKMLWLRDLVLAPPEQQVAD
jgi:hypothetical protein